MEVNYRAFMPNMEISFVESPSRTSQGKIGILCDSDAEATKVHQFCMDNLNVGDTHANISRDPTPELANRKVIVEVTKSFCGHVKDFFKSLNFDYPLPPAQPSAAAGRSFGFPGGYPMPAGRGMSFADLLGAGRGAGIGAGGNGASAFSILSGGRGLNPLAAMMAGMGDDGDDEASFGPPPGFGSDLLSLMAAMRSARERAMATESAGAGDPTAPASAPVSMGEVADVEDEGDDDLYDETADVAGPAAGDPASGDIALDIAAEIAADKPADAAS